MTTVAMKATLRVSVLQMNSHNTHEKNIETVRAACEKAKADGAELVRTHRGSGGVADGREG